MILWASQGKHKDLDTDRDWCGYKGLAVENNVRGQMGWATVNGDDCHIDREAAYNRLHTVRGHKVRGRRVSRAR